MEAERWQRVQDIFDQALEFRDDERAAFLDGACGSDGELRQEVEDMLEVDDSLSLNYLETVVMGGSALLTENFDPILRRGTIGKYKILEKVGEGGFGMVHRGVDQDLKRDVAIKTCTSSDERLRLRFQREAEISARLQHPNITTVHDLGIEDGIPYLVQEFLIGEDLSEKIERNEPLDTATRLDYLLQTARGLAHAHKNGVLHRDVKPGNMRVLKNGRLKLLDFGIARLVDERNPITTEGVAVGTVGYLSPEQFEGTGVDQRSDIFSFGVVAYELLTQTRPFPGKTFSEVSYKLMYESPVPMGELWPDCPVALEYLVSRCLEKEQDKRYQSINELIPDLEDVIRQLEDVHQGKTTLLTVGQEVERRQRNRWAIMAAGLFGLVALAVVGAFFGGRDEGPRGGQTPAKDSALAALSIEPSTTVDTRPTGEDLSASLPPEDLPSLPPPEGLSAAEPTLVPPSPTAPSPTTPPPATAESPASSPSQPQGEASDVAPSPSEHSPPPPPGAATPTEAATDSEIPTGVDGAFELAQGTTQPGADESILRLAQADGADDPLPSAGLSAETTPALESSEPSTSIESQPPEAAAPSTAVRLPVEEKAVLQRRGTPIYPRRAYRLKAEAQVTLLVRVDEGGNVVQTSIKHCTNPGLGFEKAAQEAAEGSRFRPATRDGRPISVWTEMSWDFKYQ